nr:MAG TPA: hypothetical protein [Caudoviricetes sp.]
MIEIGFTDRLMHAWNAFSNWEQRSPNLSQQYGMSD